MQQKSLKKLLFNKDFLMGVVAGVLFFFLAANVYVSQTISPLYFDLITGERQAAVDYLKNIQHEENFDEEVATYNDLAGGNVEASVFSDIQKRHDKISRLEQIAAETPHARDILYTLYELYLEEEDHDRATTFLRRAQEVDPSVGR